MKELFIVAWFTIKEMVRRKSFLISLVIILAGIVIGIGVYSSISDNSDSDVAPYYGKILLYDEGNVFKNRLPELEGQLIGYEFEISNEKNDSEAIKNRIGEEGIVSGMLISEENNSLKIEYIIDSSIGINTELPIDLIDLMNKLYKNVKLNELGIEQSAIDLISAEPSINVIEVGEPAENQGTVYIMVFATLILFYAVYFCAFQVSTAITTEKTSRIVETLVTSTKPSVIVLGKTIGIGIVGIFQVLAIVLTIVASCYTFLDMGMIGTLFDVSKLSWTIVLYIIVYFALGYLFFALLYALVGATVSKQEEVNAANTPVSIVTLLGFYLAYFTMLDPSSELAGFAAVCPISSAFCMPFRIMMDISTKQEIMFSLLVLIAFITIIARISIKVYSLAILNYGNKLKIKDVIKMYKNR